VIDERHLKYVKPSTTLATYAFFEQGYLCSCVALLCLSYFSLSTMLMFPFAITGLVKILKKYDKRSGVLICLTFIQYVLLQPFFTSDILYQIVKESKAMLDQLLP
jgi:fucose permease